MPQDGRFSILQGKIKYDFRVSTFPTKAGEKVVMRILDPLSSRIDLAGLGIVRQSDERLKEADGQAVRHHSHHGSDRFR